SCCQYCFATLRLPEVNSRVFDSSQSSDSTGPNWKIATLKRWLEADFRSTDVRHRNCYRGSACRVRVGGQLSDAFAVQEGLRQGDPLSSVLFNLVLEKLIRSSGQLHSIDIADKTLLAFADDIVIMGESA